MGRKWQGSDGCGGARHKSFKRRHNFPSTARTGHYDGGRADSELTERRE